MRPQHLLDSVVTPDGHELALWQRGDAFVITVDRYDLMLSRIHGSEQDLATLAFAELGTRPAPRVMIGGLGMGFTVRATLDVLGDAAATVVVAEAFAAVVEWNRGPLAPLAGRPLDDRRVRVAQGDVADLLATPPLRRGEGRRRGGGRAGVRDLDAVATPARLARAGLSPGDGQPLAETMGSPPAVDPQSRPPYDAILLDVDNGPEALTLAGNSRLYTEGGLRAIHRALTPGGVLAVWSTVEDDRFEHRLRAAGFAAHTRRVRGRASGKGGHYYIFLARRG